MSVKKYESIARRALHSLGLLLAKAEGDTEEDNAVALLAGTGIPNGATYGGQTLASGQTAVLLRQDGSYTDELLYSTVDGGSNIARHDPVFEVEQTLDTADVQTLNATPVEVIPAPGVGKYIEIESADAWLDYATAAYDDVGAGEDFTLRYTDGSGAEVIDAITGTGFGDATADEHRVARAKSVEPAANAAVVAHIKTGEWYAAAGDSPLKLRVRYRVRSLTW